MSPVKVLELKTDKTDPEVQAECEEHGTLTVRASLTINGWTLDIYQNSPCTVTGPDGTYIGTVQGTDDGRYEIYVELR